MNIYLPEKDYDIIHLFETLFPTSDFYTDSSIYHSNSLNDIDLVVLTGGTDISPVIYGRKPEPYTDESDLIRDLKETLIINKCVKKHIPIVGICRGAQLLNCIAGGTLIQHDNSGVHINSHDVHLKDGTTITNAAANHHQIMVINEDEAEVIGEYNSQPEIVYYPKYKFLSWQPHPEWEDTTYHVEVFKKYIEKYLFNF